MYPKVNQNISVEIKNKDFTFKTVVADYVKEEIHLSYPLDRKIIGMLFPGTKLEIIFITDDNKYYFEAEVIGRTNETIPLCRITKPLEKDIMKIQQRENFRVNATLTVELAGKEGMTNNISAGGVLCTVDSNQEVLVGEEVTGTLHISMGNGKMPEQVYFLAKVVRISHMKEHGRNNIALQFIEIDKHDQKRIIQYCFERQRQLRLTEREIRR